MHNAKQFKRSLFIFRRDLRLYDNHGLAQAIRQSQQVVACFIVDPKQVGSGNQYRSDAAIQFMVEALQDLDAQLHAQSGRLYLFYGDPADCVDIIVAEASIDAVFYNRDYTPFSGKRDAAIEKICAARGVAVVACNDLLLQEPEMVKTGGGTPYKTYTPFFKAARLLPVEKPHEQPDVHWYTAAIASAQKKDLYTQLMPDGNKQLIVHGTHTDAQEILHSLKQFAHYATERNIPALATTHLSAYLKFGLLSVRQVYYALVKAVGLQNPLIAQLYWRDFFTHLLFHNPKLLGHAGVERYDDLRWSYDKKQFQAWCDGMTGFPLVDAGMRELNTTGFMHNRVRMVTASFLVKDLQIDWRWGERYFAHNLVDYDPAVNNGNWQWVASTGTCSQPYFRVFNPWVQQKKFDPDAEYIKRWLPELADLPPRQIHALFKATSPVVPTYPLPMLDHTVAARNAIAAFKKL